MLRSQRLTFAAAAMALLVVASPTLAANIVDTAASTKQFNTLLAAARAAGLADDLAIGSPLTVFAPNDAAFRKLPRGTAERLLMPQNRDQLRAILTYHVVPASIVVTDVPTHPTRVTTLNPTAKVLAVRRDGLVHIDKARVVKADIRADNGIIHVIDSVLMPGAR